MKENQEKPTTETEKDHESKLDFEIIPVDGCMSSSGSSSGGGGWS